jgi:hypothetical protein
MLQLPHVSIADPTHCNATLTQLMTCSQHQSQLQELRGHQPFCVQEEAGSRLHTHALRNPEKITCKEADVQRKSTVSGGLVPEPDTYACRMSCTPLGGCQKTS